MCSSIKSRQNGHFPVLEYLEKKAPKQLEEMIRANDFDAFRRAAGNGHFPILEYLEKKAPQQLEEMIRAYNFDAFRRAAENGHLPVLEYLEEKAPEQLQEMISVHDFSVFLIATRGGHLPVLKYLEKKAPQQLEEMIRAGDFGAFRFAAGKGDFPILQYLEKKAPQQLQEMIIACDFGAFRFAAATGYLSVLQYLEEKAPEQLQAMIRADDFVAFGWAAGNGDFPILQYLEEKAPKQLEEMIRANDFGAFRFAAGNGHLSVLEYLEEKAPEHLQGMISADDFSVFRCAAGNGDFPILQYLIKKAPEQQFQEMISAYDFSAFRFAAGNGYLLVLQYLEEKAPKQLQAMIRADDFDAFCQAARYGHFPVLHYLEEKAPDQLQAMIRANDFYAFRFAAGNGHFPMLQYLEEKAPDQLQAMISADDFFAFRFAAENGHLSVLQYLEEKAPKQLQAMIIADNFGAFRRASVYGHLPVLQYLEEKAPDQLQAMISADDFFAFRRASVCDHFSIPHHLLQHESVLNYAESHEHEYKRIVAPFLETKWNELRERQLSFEHSYPQDVFDISAGEANYYRILWRHFIRSSTIEAQERCIFLMEIPALRNVAASHDNELLILALSLRHESAVRLLLSIESVRVQAEQYQMYAHGLDLRALSRQQENSMIALTPEEQARLERAIEKYQPILNRKTVKNIIADFKRELRARYAAAPALISGVALPFTFADFMALGLSGEQKKAALQAYYQHKVHTAYRYLSKPNFWLHEAASYVESNPLTGQRWATFEDYLPFIALLYEAARDSSSPPIDGYTLAGRVEALIDELAYIGRAHNWDRTRASRTAAAQEEEYDDLEGDKPSCYSGTKRRLFQAGRGHALFKVLSPDDVKAHIYEAFRAHIINKLQDSLVHERIKAIWATLLESPLSKEYSEYLAQFNFTPNEVETFVEKLKRQYRDGFTAELQAMVRQQFILTPNQLVYWGGQINLAGLLVAVPKPMDEFSVAFESQEEYSGHSSITPKLDFTATYAPWLIKLYNSQFFSSWQLRILSLILIIASALLLTSLVMNSTTLALAAPVIAGIVVKLSPLAFNAMLGTAIVVAAASTTILGMSLYRTGFFVRKNQDMGVESLDMEDVVILS